jgi:hypothetical protein
MRNRHRALSIAAFLLISGSAADAAAYVERGPLGLGLMFGLPVGPTGKFYFTNPSAIQVHFGYGWSKVQSFVITGDYLYHFHDIVEPVRATRTSLYIGGGMHLGFAHDVTVGIRFPVGLSFQLTQSPVEVFTEIVPGFSATPFTEFAIDGGIGVRWFF